MSASPDSSFLDRPIARLAALGVVGLCAAALLAIHWADLFPPETPAADADDPVARCVAERATDIDKMLADNVISAEQARTFKLRAEALCQDQHGGGSGPPPLPAQ